MTTICSSDTPGSVATVYSVAMSRGSSASSRNESSTVSPAASRSLSANPSSMLRVKCGTSPRPPSGWNCPLPGTPITFTTIAAPRATAWALASKSPARPLAEWLRPPGTKTL